MICDYDKMNPLDQNDFKCVGIDQICDGHSDCDDGNDETYMQCYIKHKHSSILIFRFCSGKNITNQMSLNE